MSASIVSAVIDWHILENVKVAPSQRFFLTVGIVPTVLGV
jgi:hypothetical protein